MNKRLIALLFAVLICVASITPAFAQPSVPRMVDDAALLTEEEVSELNTKLDEISERQQLDVAIVTVNSLDGATPQSYADDYFDYNGFGYGDSRDGVLFLLSMEERDWSVSTSGYGITAFTDAGILYITEQMLPYLSDALYYDAFVMFADYCDDFITQANEGEPYDVGNEPKEPFAFLAALFIGIVIGAIVSGIVCLIFALQLKSVHTQSAASDYVKKGSMHVTDSREFFLYSKTDREKKPEPSSSSGGGGSTTHTSSSGRTHGGASGKF
ncbi:MAG: TPM domain-containing protein [Ruminococcus sp.]|nr:TPM domain-containing protein [Ruminococcus sp.]